MPTPRTLGLIAASSVAAIVASLLSVITWWAAPISVGVFAWFAWHGVLFAKRVFHNHARGAHWMFGPVWGLGLCVVGMLGLWVVGGRGAWILALAPWPVWLSLLLPVHGIGDDLSLPEFTRRDLAAVLLLILIVPLVVGLPYAHVGETVDGGGRAYRAYFTADFIWAMTAVSAVSKGVVPPDNPFLTGNTLHYYWLSHFLSAVEYHVMRPWDLRIEEVTLANHIGYGVAFMAFLYGFVRAFGASTWAAASACAMVFLANSFEALDRIWYWWGRGSVWARLQDVNIDAGTRWFYQGMPVDGLQRMLLYQPHHLAGYALGLSALLLIARTRNVARPAVALAAGGFLGLSLMFSSFIAIILGVAVAIVYGVRLLTPRRWTAIAVCAILGALPVGAALWASSALGYVDPDAGSLVIFGPNPTALVRWRYLLFLSFGPLLIIGTVGLIVALLRRRWDVLPIAALAAAALTFYFMTDVPDMQHVWVGWRAGHLLFIALTALVGLAFTMLESAPAPARIGALMIVAALTVAALPTVVVDVYNAQDITNRRPGAGFPWTLVLSKSEVDALNWLKASTPPNAVVQPDAESRGTATWAYIPAFGERRMAAGLPGAMIPFKPYEDATAIVSREIFGHTDVVSRAMAARRLRIDYLYVGPVEQAAHPELVSLLDTRSDLFDAAFRNDQVTIYWVKPAEHQ